MRLFSCLLLVTLSTACRQKFPSAPAVALDGGLGAPGNYTRAVPGFSDREYDVHVPPGYDGVTALPVVMVLHGGGGDKEGARKMTCPGGDQSSPECLEPIADERGFIVVYPNGTGSTLLSGVRTWNAEALMAGSASRAVPATTASTTWGTSKRCSPTSPRW